MSTVNWEKIINDFSNLNILVIGDAMIDSYIWGDIERISPEAPIPIVKAIKYEKKLGGAANVALNIKSLGAKAKLMSVIGNNDNGLLQLMQNFDLSIEGILQEDRLTTTKTRIISNDKHQLRVDEEDTHDIKSEIEFIQLINNSLNEIDLVLFQDWLDSHNELFTFVPPKAGGMAFVGYNMNINSTEFVHKLRVEQSVLIVPGDCYGMDGYLRFGIGANPDYLNQGLQLVSACIKSLGY